MNFSKSNIIMVGIGHAHAIEVFKEIMARNDLFQILGYVENDESIYQMNKDKDPYKNFIRLNESDVLNRKLPVDAIVIETQIQDLIPTAKKYLPLHIPIHIDKPTGFGEDYLELLDYAKHNNIPIQLGYMYRYNPAIMRTRDKIMNGEIGDICYINAFMDTELSYEQRKSLVRYTGGIMYVYGCHVLDLVLMFLGKPKNIHSYINMTTFDNLMCQDTSLAILEYDKGVSIIRATGTDANGYTRRQFMIAGSKGAIEIKPLENITQMNYSKRDGVNPYTNKAKPENLNDGHLERRYYFMIDDFSNMITHKPTRFPMDYEYEKMLHKVLMEIIDKGETR